MIKIIALAGALFFCLTGTASADPISAAIGLTALLEGTFLAGAGGTIVTFFGSLALSVGLSLAANALKSSPDAAVPASELNAPDIRYNERQATPSKRIIVGTAQVGGALFFEQTKTPYLTQGILICARQVTAFRQCWIGTNEIPFSAFTVGSILTPIAVDGNPNYPARLLISLRNGSPTQPVDPLIAQDYTNLSIQPVSNSAGTAIGNMSGAGGLAAGFDNVTAQAASACASLTGAGNVTGTIGKDWGAGVTRTIAQFFLYAPSDFGFSKSADPTVIVKLRGSTDNFASSIVTLYTGPATAYASSSIVSVASGIDTSAAYRYHRVEIIEQAGDAGSHVGAVAAELQFFEPTGLEFRQRGVATAVLRYHYGADYTEFTQLWGQVQKPNRLFLVDGVTVYDPRDPTQLLADPTTWKFSNNATLVQTYYLTQPFGGRIATTKIDWDKTKQSADWDDGLIATNDGTLIKRHTVDGVFNLSQSPLDVIKGMLTANGGQVLESGGTMWVQSSQPLNPIATIYDDILTGGVDYRAAQPKKNLINRCKLRFVSEYQSYQLIDGPALYRADLEALDGELLDVTLELPFTLGGSQSGARAQRLQKRSLELARLGKTLTCQVDVVILCDLNEELVGQIVNFDSVLFAQANGLYRVTDVGFGQTFSTLQLALVEYDPTIETDWNAATDEQSLILPFLNVA